MVDTLFQILAYGPATGHRLFFLKGSMVEDLHRPELVGRGL
jgi:hypothetical protein